MSMQQPVSFTQPSASDGASSVEGEAVGRREQDQRRRAQMIGMSATNYLAVTALLSLYAWIGTVEWGVPLSYAGVTMLGSLFFWCTVQSGFNLRARDPNLFAWQMAFGGAVLFGFLAAVPQLGLAFLCNMFITAMFGAVQFNARQFRFSVLVASAAAAVVFWWVGDRLALPASTPAEVAMLWLYLCCTLVRFMAIASRVGALRGKLNEKNELLKQSLRRIQELADQDELTGALARRRFIQMTETELLRSQRSNADFCVAILDLDHFKQVNDQHGHLLGDQVLRRFCDLVRGTLRASDELGRYGGEEFVLLLPALSPAHAPALLGRVLHAVASEDWSAVAPGLRVTTSIGVAAFQAGDGVQSLLSRADAALYKAKHAGRNRAEFAFAPSRSG